MNTEDKSRQAENFERFRIVFAVMILFVGLNNLQSGMAYIWHETDYAWMNFLDYFTKFSLLLIVVTLLFYWLRLMKYRSASCPVIREAFIEKANLHALMFSWFTTFLFASVLIEWHEPQVMLFGSHDLVEMFPGRYYFLLLVSVMCISYALPFFRQYLTDSSDAKYETE